MAELLIIADDLTGAVEAGVQLGKQNIASIVFAKPGFKPEPFLSDNSFSAVVVNSESRHLTPADAAERIHQIMKATSRWNFKWFYKKTDSTMRGNIGAELEALLKETKQDILPYISAHPKLQRFTRDGYQYIGKTLIHKTVFAKDPLEPVFSSFIPDILKTQTSLEVFLLSIKKNSEPEKFSMGKAKIVVFDCSSEFDLIWIGKFLVQKNWENVMAGTAALIGILPEILPLNPVELEEVKFSGPMLIVNGSVNEISLNQVDFAGRNGIPTFFIPPIIFGDSNIETGIELQRFAGKINSFLKNGENIIISTSGIENQNVEKPLKTIHSGKNFYQNMPDCAGLLVAEVLKEIPHITLCVFGGDTLSGILNVLGAETIRPYRDLLPGVALSSVNTVSGKTALITKPGGYGEIDEILKILNQVKKKKT